MSSLNYGLWLGYTNDNEPSLFLVEPKLLKKHCGIFGSTGSGKTVLGKIIIEEMTRQGIPSIIIDPQGDIASLYLSNDEDVLLEHGLNPEDAHDFFEKSDIRVFTPGSNKGLQISLNPIIFPSFEIDEIEAVRILDNSSTTLVELLCKLVKYPNAKSAQAKSVIYTLLLDSWKNQAVINDVHSLITVLEQDQDVFQKFMNQNDKDRLLVSLNNLFVGTTGLLFSGGKKLDIGSIIETKDGKTPVNIIFLKTLLNENEKQLFLSVLIQAIYSWMIRQGSADTPRCFFYMDEVAPFIPAGMSAPPSKEILLLLLRQARKYGIACTITSQSPKDIDYHALDQLNTLFLGRMISQQSQKVIKNLLVSKLDEQKVDELIGAMSVLETSHFLGFIPDAEGKSPVYDFNTRWLFSKHTTLTEVDIKNTYNPNEDDDEPAQTSSEIELTIMENEQEEITNEIEVDDGPGYDDVAPVENGLDFRNVYRFKRLQATIAEEVIERTVAYDDGRGIFFDPIARHFIHGKTITKETFLVIIKLLEKLDFKETFKGITLNGLPLIIFRDEAVTVAACGLIADNGASIGVFGNSNPPGQSQKMKRVMEGIVKLVEKISLEKR